MYHRTIVGIAVVLFLVGCGGSDDDGAPLDAAAIDEGVLDGGMRDASPVDGGGSDATAGDGGASCVDTSRYVHGRWPAPVASFTLPGDDMYLPDVQAEYPSVAWGTIDRLYIPAGTYDAVVIGNLPTRTADHPLIITNSGGQVYIGGTNGAARLEIYGGANWVLTGRYDPTAQTGDVGFPGHWDGAYATSHARYGIEIRQHFVAHSGLKIAEASEFEVEYLEIWETGFAGLLVKTDGDPTATMRNVQLHDLYIHDTDAEGMYIGNTSYDGAAQHTFEDLHIYNNRLLRTGAEGIQISHVGRGTEVDHNVALCAVDWRDPFQALYQDGCLQVAARVGDVSVHHNVFLASGGHMFTLRTFAAPTEVPSAEDTLTLADNYFSHGRGERVAYLFSDDNTLSHVNIANNRLHAMLFAADVLDPTLIADPFLIQTRFMPNPLAITDNQFDGERFLTSSFDEPNGSDSDGSVVASGNVLAAIAPPTFADSGFPADFDYRRIERWSDCSTEYGNRPIAYEPGAYTSHEGSLYRLGAAHPAYDCTRPYFAPCVGWMVGAAPVTYAVDDVVDTGDEVHYRLTAAHAPYLCATSANLYANPTPSEDPVHWEPIVINPSPDDAPILWTEVGLPPDDVRQTCDSPQGPSGLLDRAP